MRGPLAKVTLVDAGRGGKLLGRHRSLGVQGLVQAEVVAHADHGDTSRAAQIRQHLPHELI